MIAWVPGVAPAAVPEGEPCIEPGSQAHIDQSLEVDAARSPRIALPGGQGTDLLVQVAERGIDVEASLSGRDGRTLVRADHPLTRQGVQRLVVPSTARGWFVIIRSVEYKTHRGMVRLRVSALPTRSKAAGCQHFARELAQADAAFAASQLAFRSGLQSMTAGAESQAKAAARLYATLAESAPPGSGIRGDAELAVAAIEYYSLSHWEESARWSQRATSTLKHAERPYPRARARAIELSSWLEKPSGMGALERARSGLRELAAFHQARGETYDYALQVNNIGLSHLNEAQFEPAIKQFTESRHAFEAIGERQRGALAAQNIALCEWGLGRMQRALTLFDEALEAMGPDWRPRMYLLTLNNKGMALNAAGRFDESLRIHEQTFQMAIRQSNSLYVARSQFGTGATFYAMGDRDLARQLLRDALVTMTPELDSRGRLSLLRSLGTIESETGNYALSDAYNREALGLAVSNTARERIQLKMAETAIARGDLAGAEKLIEKWSGIKDADQRLTRAQAWLVRGKLRQAQGAWGLALQDLQAALPVFADFEAANEEFTCRQELARTFRAMGREPAALREITAALELGEELRRQTANPEYSASVAAQIRPALEFKLELMRARYERSLQIGQRAAAEKLARESLEITDAARARAFELYLHQRIDPQRDPQMARLLEQLDSLQREIADRRYYLATQEDRRGAMSPVVQALRAEIRQRRLSLGVVHTQIAARTVVSLTSKDHARSNLAERFAGDERTAGIEYWLGSESAFAWVIRDGVVSWQRLGNGSRVAEAARRFHSSLVGFMTTPLRERLTSSQELHQFVIEPIRKQIAGARRLIFVPDGPLHFVPFAALRSSDESRKYLVETASIMSTPALRYAPRLAQGRPTAPTGSLLLVADPIYEAGDSRRVDLGTASVDHMFAETAPRLRGFADLTRLARLPSTAREAAAIKALFAAESVDELSGFDAIRDRFLDRDLGRYRFLHVATHGVIDSEIPAMSALVLGAYGRAGLVRDQQVRVGDLLTRTLDADLVVLSACGTSLGPSFPEEGPMGLRYAVLARGARSVVASLWATVDDRNADLMTEMYRRMVRGGENVDLALAGAMRTLLDKRSAADPALWAAYTMYIAEK